MTSLLIRDVDEALHQRLKAGAAADGRSLGDEARELLGAAVAHREAPSRENLAALARRLLGPEHGTDLAVPLRGTAPESAPPDFAGPRYGSSDLA
jgi:plasmid stability protein